MRIYNNNNNNNNNNTVICKALKVSSNAESDAPAVARWAALVGYAKRNVLKRRIKVSVVGESLVSRGIPDCGCKVAEVFQRISVAIQRFNAVLLHDGFPSEDYPD